MKTLKADDTIITIPGNQAKMDMDVKLTALAATGQGKIVFSGTDRKSISSSIKVAPKETPVIRWN